MKHTIQVDYIKYMDEIAEQIGCKPNLKKVIFEFIFCMYIYALLYIFILIPSN